MGSHPAEDRLYPTVMPTRVNWRQSVVFTRPVMKYLAVAMLLPLAIGLL